MLFLFLVSTLNIHYLIPPPSVRQPNHPCFPVLAFSYTAALRHHRTKDLSSHWFLVKPSSATYTAGAMGPSMCTLWLVVQFLGALGVSVSWYFCSSYGVANAFSSSVLSKIFLYILSNDYSLLILLFNCLSMFSIPLLLSFGFFFFFFAENFKTWIFYCTYFLINS